MITAIIVGLINLAGYFINLLPSFETRLPENIVSVVGDIFNGIGYFIPSSAWLVIAITISYYGFVFAYNVVAEIRNWTPGI